MTARGRDPSFYPTALCRRCRCLRLQHCQNEVRGTLTRSFPVVAMLPVVPCEANNNHQAQSPELTPLTSIACN